MGHSPCRVRVSVCARAACLSRPQWDLPQEPAGRGWGGCEDHAKTVGATHGFRKVPISLTRPHVLRVRLLRAEVSVTQGSGTHCTAACRPQAESMGNNFLPASSECSTHLDPSPAQAGLTFLLKITDKPQLGGCVL